MSLLSKLHTGIVAGFMLAAASAFAQDARPVMPVKITGGDEVYDADVFLQSGVRRLATDSIVTVEQVFGQDPQGTSWFFFGATLNDANGIGSAGDTVRVEIPAAPTPLATVYPAVDVTYTVTSGDISNANPEREVALNVCSALNLDANFIAAKWRCSVAKDFALVHIESKLFNEFGERSTWDVTCSGGTTCNRGFDSISRRGKPTELARSPNDPRQGILSISGTVTTIPGGIGDQFIFPFLDGVSPDMLVDGSGTPKDFVVNPVVGKDLFVQQIRCFGGGNGIKFAQFLSKSGGGLSNGMEITVKSDNNIFTFPLIKKTEDFKNRFSTTPGSDFRIDIQSGTDQFIAAFKPTQPFPVRAQGTFTTDDFMRVRIQDNISSGISELECSAFGFEKEP